MIKIIRLTFIVFFLKISFLSAEIVKPNSDIKPVQVVKIQLKGLMKNDLPYNDVDYCKYGMPYRKRTRLWNNISNFTPLPLCKKDCHSMIGNRHISMGQHDRNSTKDLYVIPPLLIFHIFHSMIDHPPPQ